MTTTHPNDRPAATPAASAAEGRGRGPRRGRPNTRGAILIAARSCFAAHGLAGCSIRTIAANAGVDPALIYHYFGSKQGLFLATVQLPLNPADIIKSVVRGPRTQLGIRLASAVLGAWESPAQEALIAAARTAITDPQLGNAVEEFVTTELLGTVLDAVECPPDERAVRGSMVASQLLGTIVGRHVLKIGPLATIPLAELIPQVGATLQHHLTGRLR